uniref:USP domain-containing protein n=1 Tax=Acrobeloides nanus TaxID=290746 RepID=A0A914BVJ5_9BILA
MQYVSDPYEVEQQIKANRFALLSNVVQPPTNGLPSEIIALRFDARQELLWSGNVAGRIHSYYGQAMEKYTSFYAAGTPIRDLETVQDVALAATSNCLTGFKRNGSLAFNHASPLFEDIYCINSPVLAPNMVFLGGNQQTLVQLDVETCKEQRILSLKEPNCIMMRSDNRNLYTADSLGNITVRSWNTPDPINTIPAHSGAISDFDVYGNRLISCGYTSRLGKLHSDPFLKVYDIRNFRSQMPVSVMFPPVFCRFANPYFDGQLLVVSKFGAVFAADLNSPIMTPVYYGISTPLNMAISSSRQCAALSDASGAIYLFSERTTPLFNIQTTWSTPNPLTCPPLLTKILTKDLSSCSQIPNQSYLNPNGDDYASDWLSTPDKKRQINDSMSGFINNPDAVHEFADYKGNNKMSNSLYDGFGGQGFDAEFVQDGYTTMSEQRGRPFPSKHPDVPTIFPQLYKRTIQQRMRHNSTDETNYAKWNLSQYTSIIENPTFAYVNTPLHAMYFLKPIRNMFLNHLCEDEHCTCCQIGFLYRMLYDQQVESPVANSNLIRSLKMYAEISAISMIKEGKSYGYFVKELQAYLRVIFKQIKKELPRRYLQEPDTSPTLFSKILGASYTTTSRCSSCGSKEIIQDELLTVILDYSKIQDNVGVPFTQVLEENYNYYNKQMEKCKRCLRMAYAESRREYAQLPPVLAVDVNLTSLRAREFWLTQNKIYDTRPDGSLNEFDARFVVTNKRPAAVKKNGRVSPEANPLIIGSEHRSTGAIDRHKAENSQKTPFGHTFGKWGHYLPSRISVKEENGRWNFSESSGPGTINYMLCACVMAICEGENNFSHFVTIVKDSNPKEPFKNWVVFNDHIVTPVNENEALFTDLNWKWPCLLFYVNPLHEIFKSNDETHRMSIPKEVFDACKNLASHSKSAPKPNVPLEELPKPGDIIGLDAEFIHISECRTHRSVGRVSCVTEDKIIVDDFIIMPESDIVHDYVTEYSGIVESDLDPHKSTKYLTTLKSTYMKLLYLVENKVIFVGHALNNDFRMLNIYVPPAQIQDTVQLFSLPNYKLLSLQFLAKEILNEDIQQKTHDSIEDARMALTLYRKYNEMKGGSGFVNIMLKLYETWSSQRSSPVTAAIRYAK